jgi:hypothetical protein
VRAGEKGAFKSTNPSTTSISKSIVQFYCLDFRILGITALVDEATGYQYDRERDELQKILSKYISNELLAWQKTFSRCITYIENI